MHSVCPNDRLSSQAWILSEENPVPGDSNLRCSVSHHPGVCIHLRQIKTPRRRRPGRLFYCNHWLYHYSQPGARFGKCTIWSVVSHRFWFLRGLAWSLDPAFEQRFGILQDSLCHGYGNWSGQRWRICCVVLFPIQSGPFLLDRIQDYLFPHVHGNWTNLCLCGWPLVRESAEAIGEAKPPPGGRG